MDQNPSNLFDLSASGSPKKKPKPAPITPAPIKSDIQDFEAKDMLKKMKEMHKELTDKLEVLIKQSGYDPQDFKASENFSPDQWSKLQDQKMELEAKILGMSEEGVKQHKKQKLESLANKERKGKTLGVRKRWLDMR